ncbi:unnamed protein product, partial [Rangifer tarandus platyrhynchus]
CMEELEKDHEHFLSDEQSESRQGMAMLQDKIIIEAVSSNELQMLQKFLLSLLF